MSFASGFIIFGVCLSVFMNDIGDSKPFQVFAFHCSMLATTIPPVTNVAEQTTCLLCCHAIVPHKLNLASRNSYLDILLIFTASCPL